MNILLKINWLIWTVFLSLGAAISVCAEGYTSSKKPISILTDVWPPYVNERGHVPGVATLLVDSIAKEVGIEVLWEHFPYGISYSFLKRGKASFAYPFFKTPQRAENVIFSLPILSVTSRMYVNRQFTDPNRAAHHLGGLMRLH